MWSTGETSASIDVSPTISTSYSVTVSNSSCNAVDQMLLTVNALPSVSAGGDQSICEGETIVLTASGGSSYIWSNGETTASNSVSPVGTTTYSVTVSSNGCSASDQATVTVNPYPVADAGIDQEICDGGSVTLTATGGSSYFWSTSSVSAQITVSPVITTQYYVTVSEGSCVAVDSVTVEVNPGLNPTIDATLSEVCSSQSSVLTANGGVNYLWDDGSTTATTSH